MLDKLVSLFHHAMMNNGAGTSSSSRSDDRLDIEKQQQFRGRVRSSHGDYEMGTRTNPFMPVTSKQIYFVLNGHPHRVYRALVNPLRRGHLDTLLEEVSAGLQAAIFRLYSFEGDRILSTEQLLLLKDMRAIAVPRHERLILNGMTQSDILRLPMRHPPPADSSLPPIGNTNSSTSKSSKSSSGASQKAGRTPSNNIDRLPAYDDPMARPNFGESMLNQQMRKRSRTRSPRGGVGNQQEHLPKAPAALLRSAANARGNDSSTMRQSALTSGSSLPQGNVGSKTIAASNIVEPITAASTSNTTADSDSGRPRSVLELPTDELLEEEGPIHEEKEEEAEDVEDDENDEEEDDYPEEPPELLAMHSMAGGWQVKSDNNRKMMKMKRRKRRKKSPPIDEEEEEEEKAEKLEEEKQNDQKRSEDDDEEKVREEEGRKEKEEDGPKEEPKKEEKKRGSGRSIGTIRRKKKGQMQVEVIHSSDEQHQGTIPTIGGQYSEELELILYGQAAVKIQSAWRGYAVRKELKRTRFAEHPTIINGDGGSSRRGHKGDNNKNATTFYKPNERHQAIVQRVKTPMPGHKGGGPSSVLKKKKESSSMLDPSDYETMADSASDREEPTVLELVQGKKAALGWEMGGPEKSPSLSRKSPKTDYIYTVTVITGNRWAADTEADLYIVLHGANMDSQRLWLRQEFTNWLQCGPNGQHFRQNQSDSFSLRVPNKVGIVKKLTVGHECRGYGAGIFIDRILVTEDEEEEQDDCRQFLFLCNKWFDSGQVDGKLERTLRLSAFYEIGSIPVDNRVTRGRWELVLHSGTEKGQGGTSSQLAITGYGTRGQSVTGGLYDSDMAKAPSESLMQVDFGDIGELLKIRIEIDGAGGNPDYFLNFVEFKDLDTDERFVVMCGKWLRWHSNKKGHQPFRELFAFHIGVEPLPLICYEGKIRMLAPRIECLSQQEVLVELHGDLGETGFFRVEMAFPLVTANEEEEMEKLVDGEGDEENLIIGQDEEQQKGNEKIDIAFKVEAVSVGRVVGARVRFEPNQMGQQIVEGLLAVQSLFQKQGVWPLASNSEFLIGRILLRESPHTPYRYVLTRSQFQEKPSSVNAEGGQQFCTKEMLTTEMEGISTRLPKRKEPKRMKPNWILQISLAYGSTLLPEVILCGENGSARMLPLDTNPADGMLSFQPEPEADDIGALRKVRIFAEGQIFLSGIQPAGNNGHKDANNSEHQEPKSPGEEGEDDGPFTLVEKMRVCDTANGLEMRFPTADCHLQRHSVYEMSAIWPDRPPIPIVIYLIRIVTGGDANTTNNPAGMTVRLNLSGEFGDVGWRTLSTAELERPTAIGTTTNNNEQQQIALFAPNTRNSFEFEAVSIGELDWAEVEVHSDQADFHWECTEMVVTDTNTALFYTFTFERPFSSSCPTQRCQTLPFTNAL